MSEKNSENTYLYMYTLFINYVYVVAFKVYIYTSDHLFLASIKMSVHTGPGPYYEHSY